MRHQRSGKQLSRTAEHRRALLRNLVTELFRHERIETTAAKAKEARSLAEKLITFAKRGDLHARRRVDRYLMSREVTRKLFSTIAPWYEDRPGGYTRIIRTRARLGDGAEMAFLELVKSEEQMSRERKAREAAAEAKAEKKGKTRKPKAEAASEDAEEKPKKKAKTRTRTSKSGGKAAKGKGSGTRKSSATKSPARVKKGDG